MHYASQGAAERTGDPNLRIHRLACAVTETARLSFDNRRTNALYSLRRTIRLLCESNFNNKMIEYAKNNQIDLAIGGLIDFLIDF